jgi:hypothetical protein
MPRKYTNLILEAIDDGLLDALTVATAALSALSESQVKDLAWDEEWEDIINPEDEDDKDNEDDEEEDADDEEKLDW